MNFNYYSAPTINATLAGRAPTKTTSPLLTSKTGISLCWTLDVRASDTEHDLMSLLFFVRCLMSESSLPDVRRLWCRLSRHLSTKWHQYWWHCGRHFARRRHWKPIAQPLVYHCLVNRLIENSVANSVFAQNLFLNYSNTLLISN